MSRKLFIKSDPPGAAVLLDGQRVGTTPWEGELGSYGTRQVELELAGHQRRLELIELPTPWWQYPVLDIVTDLLLPWTIEDHRSFTWTLAPLDPEEGSWEDARAAETRMKAARARP